MIIGVFLFACVVLIYYTKSFVIGALVGLGLYLAFAPPLWLCRFITHHTGVVFHFDTVSEQTLYLTIDDGPTPYTHHILRALRECNNSSALFFLIGQQARLHPRALFEIIGNQQQLGNHDKYNHISVLSRTLAGDLLDTKKILQEALVAILGSPIPEGYLTTWFRPGCGLFSPRLLRVARNLDLGVLLGDCYGHDTMFTYFPWFLSWFYSWRVRSGANVVILHDGSERRALNTAMIIRHLYSQGYRFRPLPEPVKSSK